MPFRRKKIVDPILEMHPETVGNMGIREGDWVWIETHHNESRFKRKVNLSSHLYSRVVRGNMHFFNPEKMTLKDRLESNINLTHTLDGPLDPIDGAPQMRGVPYRITLAE